MTTFKMGSLDHNHLTVSDRYKAAAWYQENLGFEIVDAYQDWAEVEGGPLHISADGGRSGLALFEASEAHPHAPLSSGIAFSVDCATFVSFAESLKDRELPDSHGSRLELGSVVDHDHCYAFYFDDPYGNAFELDCYEHAAVKRALVDKHGITPVRFW